MAQAERQQQCDTYRWIVLAAVCTLAFMTTGTRSTLGVFFKSIVNELGWSRGTISMVVAVNIWLSGLLQPFTGHVLDRYGAKWLFTGSVAVFSGGVTLISFTHSGGYLLLIYGVVMSTAIAGVSMSLMNALVAQSFPDYRRGLAIGINNAGAAMGQLCLVWVSAMLLQAVGWRLSHMYIGIALLALTVPVALLLPSQHRPSKRTSQSHDILPTVRGPLETEQWQKALQSTPLWQINAGYFVCGMTVALYYTHLIPFATDRGFSTATAASAFGLLSVCSAIGALISGAVSDRLGRKNVLGLAYAVRAVAFAVILFWRHDLALYTFAVFAGLSWLATPAPVMALTGEVYGMRTLGTLGGISLLVHQLGGGASVWLAGGLYDLTGSYELSFTLGLLALVGASVVSFTIAERHYSVRYVVAARPVG